MRLLLWSNFILEYLRFLLLSKARSLLNDRPLDDRQVVQQLELVLQFEGLLAVNRELQLAVRQDEAVLRDAEGPVREHARQQRSQVVLPDPLDALAARDEDFCRAADCRALLEGRLPKRYFRFGSAAWACSGRRISARTSRPVRISASTRLAACRSASFSSPGSPK